jgi:DNA-binding transcriptional regulator YhcF (GntR family)
MMQTNHGQRAAEVARVAQESTMKFQGQHRRQGGGAVSDKITSGAYETKLGNPVAKSILALVANQVNAVGYGWPSIRLLHERLEVSARTVQRHIQVFEVIGMLEREERRDPLTGKRLNDAFQLSLEKLGTDLSKEFAAAFSKVQAKVSPATLMGVSRNADAEVKAARWLLEELGIASSPNDVRIIAQVIAYAARDASCEVRDATKALESAARNAMARGELVNFFWFKDRKFAQGANRPSKAKQRLDNNRRALAAALAKLGVAGPWDADGADGAAEAGAGPGGFDGCVHGGPPGADHATWDAPRAGGNDGVAHFARPEILPPA